jgi:hypothetical protein
MGAKFALVATPKGGPGTPVELSLIDVATAAPRDAALVAAGSDPSQLDAAVMRLDEEARRLVLQQQSVPGATPVPPAGNADNSLGPPLLLTPSPSRATFRDDPAAWARDRWPLLTAIGVFGLTVIALGAVVGSNR